MVTAVGFLLFAGVFVTFGGPGFVLAAFAVAGGLTQLWVAIARSPAVRRHALDRYLRNGRSHP